MFLQIQNIKKSYGKIAILQNIKFSIAANTTVSILGKSGCGKSTLLKIIAGLTFADEGTILLNKKNITSIVPNLRNIVYLSQEPLLFPHLNVFDNIAFGLKIRHVCKESIKQQVVAMLANIELESEALKKPDQLSGGQKQRVAFARALIINPPLLLLDEPFSSLDAEVRTNMQILFKRIAQQYACTALFVTHDVKEALIIGDSIAYMQQGHLELFASKQDFINNKNTGVQNEINFWKNL